MDLCWRFAALLLLVFLQGVHADTRPDLCTDEDPATLQKIRNFAEYSVDEILKLRALYEDKTNSSDVDQTPNSRTRRDGYGHGGHEKTVIRCKSSYTGLFSFFAIPLMLGDIMLEFMSMIDINVNIEVTTTTTAAPAPGETTQPNNNNNNNNNNNGGEGGEGEGGEGNNNNNNNPRSFYSPPPSAHDLLRELIGEFPAFPANQKIRENLTRNPDGYMKKTISRWKRQDNYKFIQQLLPNYELKTGAVMDVFYAIYNSELFGEFCSPDKDEMLQDFLKGAGEPYDKYRVVICDLFKRLRSKHKDFM